MKLVLTALAIALATSTVAAAAPDPADRGVVPGTELEVPSADRVELARKFVALTGAAHNPLADIDAGMWQQAASEIPDKSARADAEQKVRQLLAGVQPTVSQLMPIIEKSYALSYAREFTADELRQMIAFVETPAGKHFMSEWGVVESDDAIMDAQGRLWEAVGPVMQEMREVLCAERTAQRIASGDVKAKCPLASEPETASG
jgi:hypothetical protein